MTEFWVWYSGEYGEGTVSDKKRMNWEGGGTNGERDQGLVTGLGKEAVGFFDGTFDVDYFLDI